MSKIHGSQLHFLHGANELFFPIKYLDNLIEFGSTSDLFFFIKEIMLREEKMKVF